MLLFNIFYGFNFSMYRIAFRQFFVSTITALMDFCSNRVTRMYLTAHVIASITTVSSKIQAYNDGPSAACEYTLQAV